MAVMPGMTPTGMLMASSVQHTGHRLESEPSTSSRPLPPPGAFSVRHIFIKVAQSNPDPNFQLEQYRHKQCCGSALVSMRIRIQILTSLRIRILHILLH
jgi:hypothetical protein